MGTLALDQDQQPAGEANAGDLAMNTSRRRAFPGGKSALMLVAARPRDMAATRWGTKRYLQMNRLAEIWAIA